MHQDGAHHNGGIPRRRAALIFIYAFMMIDILSFGIIIPVFPKLIESLSGGDAVEAAITLGWFGTVWALTQLIFSPLTSLLSDRFGRRPILLVSCFGLGFDFLFMALAPSVTWLFVGRIISGVTAASFTTASAYVADVTQPENRAAAYGRMGAAWGLGFVLGPALGGVLGRLDPRFVFGPSVGGILGEVDPRLPFWVAAALALGNAMYGLFVLPESLPLTKRSAFTWRRANPVAALTFLSHPTLRGLAAVNLAYFLAYHVMPNVFVLYAAYRYGWTEMKVGLTLAAVGACSVVAQGWVVPRLVARVGEGWTLLAGLFFGIAGMIIYGWAPTESALWLGVPVVALMGLYGPAMQSLMTQRVKSSEQGHLQGANSSILAFTGLVGPLLFTQVFAWSISSSRDLPGISFYLSAALLAVALLVAWRIIRRTV